MKTWQHGYDIDYLLGLEAYYKEYNQYSCSPFSAVKKNTIAEGLHKKTLMIYEQSSGVSVLLDTKISKVRSAITMYGNIEIGIKEKGDRTITNLTWAEGQKTLASEILTSFDEPCWLYVWAEDAETNTIAKEAGFKWVGTKVTTFAELYAIYFREAKNTGSLFNDEERQHPTRMSVEDCSLEKTNIELVDLYNCIFPLIK